MSESPGDNSVELRNQMTAFLNFCRIEKGLSANSLHAYSADLSRFIAFLDDASEFPGPDRLRIYLDHLYADQLSARSIARHLTTLRNFYRYLLQEGVISTDPTEHLRTPRQWHTIPKFLNLQEIEAIIKAPNLARPNGLRDRAMMELL